MFRSQEMKKVELVIPRQDVVPVTEALAASSVFHLAPKEYSGIVSADHQDGDNWHERASLFASLEQRTLLVMEALCVEEGEPPPEAYHIVEPEVAIAEVEHLEREAQVPLKEMEEEQLKLNQLGRVISQLELVESLNVDLDTVRNLRYLFAMMGNIPAANLGRLRGSLAHIPSHLIELKHDGHIATVILFGAKRDAEVLTRAARSAYLNPINLPEMYRGTPTEVIESLKAGIERTSKRIAECHHAIDKLHETRVKRLQHLLWRVRASHALVDTIAKYGRLRFTYLVSGWVPASRLDELRRAIAIASGDVQIEVATPDREQETDIPTSMESPPFLEAFQGLVTNYGHPVYGEMNPTLVLALTFPLVFGVMFGDVVHGLVLALLGMLLMSRVVRKLKKVASLGTILIACGVSATIFGFLYNSFFGIEHYFEYHLLSPLREPTVILQVAIFMGAGLLSLGMVLSGINSLRARRWGHALFGHSSLASLIFYWSLIGLAVGILGGDLPITPTQLAAAAGISGLAVAFGKTLERLIDGHRPLVEDNIVAYLMNAFFGVFELVIGLLSNTLSYVRTGAFAVAHGALGVVVFEVALALSAEGSVPYWIIIALGNLFIIGFEGMIVTIQTLRLEYYEFFSRFFSGGGVRYCPMELMHKESAQQ